MHQVEVGGQRIRLPLTLADVDVADGGLRSPQGLLASLRVLDLTDDDGDAVTRLFADLGADVLKVEPPGGSPSRTRPPTLGSTSLRFALHNANKRCAVLDPSDPDDRTRFVELAGSADIVVDSGNPGRAAVYGTSCADLPVPQRPAPLPGQDTREICHKVLGMTSEETERLIDDGVLFATTEGFDDAH